MDKQTIAFKLLFCLHFYTLTQQDNLEPFTSFISQQNGLGKKLLFSLFHNSNQLLFATPHT